MRKEASIQEWKDLYQAATIIKELKPWEHFWDMDLIGIQEGKEEDTVFSVFLEEGEAVSGMILKADMLGPEEDPRAALAENIVGFIMEHGAPKEIRVTNVIVESVLEHICESAEIRLRRVKRLSGLDGFRKEMGRFTG